MLGCTISVALPSLGGVLTPSSTTSGGTRALARTVAAPLRNPATISRCHSLSSRVVRYVLQP